jgi:hypothetical protein
MSRIQLRMKVRPCWWIAGFGIVLASPDRGHAMNFDLTLGYKSMTASQTLPASSDLGTSTGTSTTLNFSGQTFTMLPLDFGLFASMDKTSNKSSTDSTRSFSQTVFGATVGGSLPVLFFSLFSNVGINVMAQSSIAANASDADKTASGTSALKLTGNEVSGYRGTVGIAYSVLPTVYTSLSYRIAKETQVYRKVEVTHASDGSMTDIDSSDDPVRVASSTGILALGVGVKF